MSALTIAGEPVKVLTVKPPWAWAIAYGGKDVENRATLWRYRGWLLTHAGAGWSTRGFHDQRVVDAWWDVWRDAGRPFAESIYRPHRALPLALMRQPRVPRGRFGRTAQVPPLDWPNECAMLRSHVLSLSRLVDAHRAGPDCSDDCAGSEWPETEYVHADGRTIHDVVHLVLHDTVPLPEPIPYPFGGLGLRDPRPELVEEVRRLDLFDAGASDIRTESRPRRGDHGLHLVIYRHHGATREARGYTAALALQRAVADSQARLRAHQEDTTDDPTR